MSLTFRIRPHLLLPGREVVEVWDGDEFIAAVVTGDGRSINIHSIHELTTIVTHDDFSYLAQVRLGQQREQGEPHEREDTRRDPAPPQ